MELRRYRETDREAVVALSLRAWAPVFASLERALDPEVYRAMHPDWRADQRAAVEAACADEGLEVHVAVEGGAVVGFAALRLHREDRLGEVYMIAVDPGHQRRGVATALTRRAEERMREAGMRIAMVETGGDPGHAPARAAYEAMGFRVLPIARYFKRL